MSPRKGNPNIKATSGTVQVANDEGFRLVGWADWLNYSQFDPIPTHQRPGVGDAVTVAYKEWREKLYVTQLTILQGGDGEASAAERFDATARAIADQAGPTAAAEEPPASGDDWLEGEPEPDPSNVRHLPTRREPSTPAPLAPSPNGADVAEELGPFAARAAALAAAVTLTAPWYAGGDRKPISDEVLRLAEKFEAWLLRR